MTTVLLASVLLAGALDSSAFWALMKEGKWPEVESALTAEPDLAEAEEHGMTVPTFLLFHQQEKLAQTAADHKSNLSLWEAAELGRYGRLKQLVDQHPKSIERFSPAGFTALHLAGGFGRFDCVVFLLRYGAPLDVLATGKIVKNAPVAAAVFGGDEPCVHAILAAGANPDTAGEGGFTALHLAAANGRLDLVKLLLRFGAKAETRTSDGKTAADLAKQGGHKEIVELLSHVN